MWKYRPFKQNKHFIISMKKLKEEIELLGHKNVITYLNSGNIILEIDRWSWDSTK